VAVAGAGVALEHSCADGGRGAGVKDIYTHISIYRYICIYVYAHGGRGAGVKDICTHIHIYLYMYIYIYMLMVAEVLV